MRDVQRTPRYTTHYFRQEGESQSALAFHVDVELYILFLWQTLFQYLLVSPTFYSLIKGFMFYTLLDTLPLCTHPVPHQGSIGDSTTSAECFALAHKWISICTKHHRRCSWYTRRNPDGYYPTRLLDLRPERTDVEVCLCITHHTSPETPYMTLSHCWGTTEVRKLTKRHSNLFRRGSRSLSNLEVFEKLYRSRKSLVFAICGLMPCVSCKILRKIGIAKPR